MRESGAAMHLELRAAGHGLYSHQRDHSSLPEAGHSPRRLLVGQFAYRNAPISEWLHHAGIHILSVANICQSKPFVAV